VLDRQPVREPLQTGIKAIDAMIPIGRGQRELITETARPERRPSFSTPSSSKGRRCYLHLLWHRAKRSTIAQVVKTLTDAGAMDYTIV